MKQNLILEQIKVNDVISTRKISQLIFTRVRLINKIQTLISERKKNNFLMKYFRWYFDKYDKFGNFPR